MVVDEVLRQSRGERSAFVRPRIQTHVIIVPVVTSIFAGEVTLALSASLFFDNSGQRCVNLLKIIKYRISVEISKNESMNSLKLNT